MQHRKKRKSLFGEHEEERQAARYRYDGEGFVPFGSRGGQLDLFSPGWDQSGPGAGGTPNPDRPRTSRRRGGR